MSNETKTCTKCGETKAVVEFSPHKTTKDQRHTRCRACRREYWAAIAADPEQMAQNRTTHRKRERAARAQDRAGATASRDPWSPEDLEMAADETLSHREVATALGRTAVAVSAQRQKLRKARMAGTDVEKVQ